MSAEDVIPILAYCAARKVGQSTLAPKGNLGSLRMSPLKFGCYPPIIFLRKSPAIQVILAYGFASKVGPSTFTQKAHLGPLNIPLVEFGCSICSSFKEMF